MRKQNNTAGLGGGVYVASSNKLFALATVVSNNTAQEGGGMRVASSLDAVLTNCEIRGNTATDIEGGGGIRFTSGSATLNFTTVTVRECDVCGACHEPRLC